MAQPFQPQTDDIRDDISIMVQDNTTAVNVDVAAGHEPNSTVAHNKSESISQDAFLQNYYYSDAEDDQSDHDEPFQAIVSNSCDTTAASEKYETEALTNASSSATLRSNLPPPIQTRADCGEGQSNNQGPLDATTIEQHDPTDAKYNTRFVYLPAFGSVKPGNALDLINQNPSSNSNSTISTTSTAIESPTTSGRVEHKTAGLDSAIASLKEVLGSFNDSSTSELYEACLRYCSVYDDHIVSSVAVPGVITSPILRMPEYPVTPTKNASGAEGTDARSPSSTLKRSSAWASPCRSPKKPPCPFTQEDELEILGAIIKNNLQKDISRLALWTDIYESLSVTCRNSHTPSSVQERFKKKIFPNLTKFIPQFGIDKLSRFPPKYQGIMKEQSLCETESQFDSP